MYNNASVAVGSASAGTALAATGTNVIWAGLASFALVATGMAVSRILPKRNKKDEDA